MALKTSCSMHYRKRFLIFEKKNSIFFYFRIVQVAPQSYLANLPEHESKEFLLKLSSRWRKRVEEVDETESAQSAHDNATDNQKSFNNAEASGTSPRNEPYIDNDDTDVLTQAARGVAHAYHQAAEYASKPEKECIVQ